MASLDECLKLLRGSNDEQRLVGLLLATKFVSGGDAQAVHEVFDAIGFQFVDRLLRTGLGHFATHEKEMQQHDYLKLGISILAAFCRIPELASSSDVIDKVPVYVEVLSAKDVSVDASECLLGIAAASDKGFVAVCQSRVFQAIGSLLQNAAPEAQEVVAVVKLLYFLVTRLTMEGKTSEYAQELASVVPPLSRHLSLQQNLGKFEVMEVLKLLLVSSNTKAVLSTNCASLSWADDVRTGLGQILHSRVSPEHRKGALEVAEQMVEHLGGSWLVGNINFPDTEVSSSSSDRFLFLVVESLRVEIPIVLGDVLHVSSSSSGQDIEKQRSLAVYYSLVENIINFTSQEEASIKVNASSLQKIVSALDDIAGILLEYLEAAKDNGVHQGDEVISSVRLLGRYLAEAPSAHNTRFLKLLSFLLSVTPDNETSPYYAVQFLVPALLQVTMAEDGCEALVSSGGHKQIVSFIVTSLKNRDEVLIVEALDILLNVLQKKNSLIHEPSFVDFVPALREIVSWALKTDQNMESAMATCFCTSVLDMTDEGALKDCLEASELERIYTLVGKCLQRCYQGEAAEEEDLMDMIVSGCLACLNRYPSLKSNLKSYLALIPDNRSSTPSLRMLAKLLS
ncbi:neurochondrin isoform X1 [Selaginella moellendorffii]|uniref:neurochondrin isoform X1 n=1 Tax=Selaginella moellendorffii TaxID=88036 RepID=UPI000D1C9C45|nr:neurochondrin isoform X1 [Selaginella moellendorffii]|eukprot:XP_024533049.1 neurochondrin isoform X1 [Selaginella moellendorffii]